MMISSKEIPAINACSAFEISRSSYYAWKNHEIKTDADTDVRKLINDIALEFSKYGYRRITKELHRRNKAVNHKKVLRIMREGNLLVRKKKFRPITTDSGHGLQVYPNLAKDLQVTSLNQLWVSDITYIQLLNEYVYLAVIIEIFSRKCIGWDLSRSIDTRLTLNALNMAISDRKSIGFENLIHHSDQGVQYASKDYVNRLKENGIKISMSRKGNVYDNAFAESFIKTLKTEEVYVKEYKTMEEAYDNIKEFVEKVYNKKRLHSSIGYVPPEEFEEKILKLA